LVKEEIKKEIKDFLEFNENEAIKYPNLWDKIKAPLEGKYIGLSAFKKKLERAYTSSLTAHLKAVEQKETNSPKRSRWQEIIKSLSTINKIDILLARLTRGHRDSILIKSEMERET
jgi:transketolase